MLDYIIIFEFDFVRLILKIITSFLYTHIHIHTGGMYAHVTVKRDGLFLKNGQFALRIHRRIIAKNTENERIRKNRKTIGYSRFTLKVNVLILVLK